MTKINFLEWIGIIACVVLFATVLGLLFAWPFQLIWNYSIVAAVSVAEPIGFWQAFWFSWFFAVFVRSSPRSSDK